MQPQDAPLVFTAIVLAAAIASAYLARSWRLALLYATLIFPPVKGITMLGLGLGDLMIGSPGHEVGTRGRWAPPLAARR